MITVYGLNNLSFIDLISSLQNLTNQFVEDSSIDGPITYVSIHVRRTDYGIYLDYWYKKSYVEDDYFAKAVQFYRDNFTVSFSGLALIHTFEQD